jgi:hypothetical protein
MDLATVDTLARLQLAGRRLGFRLRLYAPPETWALVEFVGLREVIRQPEEREQPLGVEEERELDDPAAG